MIGKMGRKGEDTALKNFVSIIIAVIGIVAVVYGIVKLSSIFINQESANAKNTLENIAGRLEALEAGQSSTFLLQGFSGADNWVVSAWNNTQSGRPDKCYFKSCLCVCPLEGDVSESCQQKGFCQTFDYTGVVVEQLTARALMDSDLGYETQAFLLPVNAAECRIELVKDSSSSFARVQLEPKITQHYYPATPIS